MVLQMESPMPMPLELSGEGLPVYGVPSKIVRIRSGGMPMP